MAKQSLSKIRATASHYDHHPSGRKLSNFHTNGKPSLSPSLPKQVGAAPDLPYKKRRREKELPCDKILQDPVGARTALELRKRSAFLGYTYRRCELPDLSKQYGEEEERLRRRIVRGIIPWDPADADGG